MQVCDSAIEININIQVFLSLIDIAFISQNIVKEFNRLNVIAVIFMIVKSFHVS